MKLVLSAATLGALPTAALARHHDGLHVDVDIRSGHVERHDDCPPVYQERETRVWVEPVYRTVADRQWIEPVYRTVTERVWREPVVQRVKQRVWAPDRYEDRQVMRYERGREVVYHERVLVERGHFGIHENEVVVSPGHYEDVARQELVCEGHWQTIERQELVAPGHWETRVERVAIAPPPPSPHRGEHIELRLPFPR
jgi:hypothetical protein